MKPREEIELPSILNDPGKAREFISEIDWTPEYRPEYLVLGGDDMIFLDNMSDVDAVRAAQWILNVIELPKIQRTFELTPFPH